MANKRRSLADIVNEDNKLNPAQPRPGPTELRAVSKSVAVEEKSENRKEKSENGFPKSEFIKMSVTVPPDMFEALQDLSRNRRRGKEPHTMSDLVREAVASWLPAQKI